MCAACSVNQRVFSWQLGYVMPCRAHRPRACLELGAMAMACIPPPTPCAPPQVAAAVGCFHVLCGIAAGAVSGLRGERWAPRVAKVLAVGFLALVEVVLLPDGGDQA